ncbi:GAF domain-containing protein [Granulicella tundricola]|uniref:GAF domain-containing protein n=1 Tax=Granulicella tundricola TaxID=940615 RepID=UPI0012FC13AB|nr:GAF domain-containing protein [Granulicella tundricola]
MRNSWIPVDESAFEQEVIHTPGLVQPFGVLLACRRSDLRIVHVSANCDWILGREPREVLQMTLPALFGQEQSDEVTRALSEPGHRSASRLSIGKLRPGGLENHVVAHTIDADLICIELEPSLPGHRWDLLSKRLESIVEALQKTGSQQDLCDAAAKEMRALTGHDHVMIYKFHPDHHGEVIAEDKIAELSPNINLHFPASDIPQQARALYLLQRTRLIADVDYVPVPLVSLKHASVPCALDMTYSSLRSVSPMHLQYLRNMKVGASFSISLVHEQKLWGLIICQHRTPLLVPPEVRSLCDLLGQVISMLTGVTQNNEDYVEQLFNGSRLKELESVLAGPCVISEMLVEHADLFLGSVGASGATICIDGQLRSCGTVLPPHERHALLALLKEHGDEPIFLSEYLAGIMPALKIYKDVASGILAIPLDGSYKSYVLWYRPEITQTVEWGGNPNEAKVRDVVTGLVGPRESFAAWRESVSGHAKAWSPRERAMALDVQRLLKATVSRQGDAAKAKLSLVDVLTLLPNRRVLLDRLSRLQEDGVLEHASLLFVTWTDSRA